MLNNYGTVESHKIGRSAQPDAKGFADLTEHGFKTIIKLSDENEYPLKTEQAQFKGGIVLYRPVSIWHPDKKSIKSIAAEVKKYAVLNHPVLVHCRLGKDRTGAVVGAYRLIYNKWPIKKVLDEMHSYGANMIADIMLVNVLKQIAKER